jgi:TPR repeat protein
MSLRTRLLPAALVALLAALAGCAPSPFPTQTQRMMLEPAQEAEARGDFQTAFREYEAMAENGTPFAQYKLARMYEKGIGTEPNAELAARWYRASAESRYPPAEIALGKLYEQGEGVPKDYAAALALYQRAVEYEQSYAYQMDPPSFPAEAHVRAGQLIELGRGTEANPAEAARYYEAAAEAGNPDGAFALAELYRNGEGVAADPAAADRWYAAAAASYASPERASDARAKERLGEMYLAGFGVPKDVPRGLALLDQAAKERTSAQLRLAELFAGEDGGIASDPARAAGYYQMAADAGRADGMYRLAELYATGEGVPEDGGRAVELYREAAAAGEPRAYGKLADLYAAGAVVPEDDVEANALFAEGARHGDGRAAMRLGQSYEDGVAVEADPVQALGWYKIADALGEDRASAEIARIEGELQAAQIQQATEIAEAWRRENGAS